MMASVENKKSFRFGIMTNGDLLKRWQVEAVERLITLGHSPVLVIENAGGWNKGGGKLKKYTGKNALYNLYVRLFMNGGMMENIDYSSRLSAIEKIKVVPLKKGKYSLVFPQNDVETIKSYKLDFILRFGFNIIKGDILDAAKYGIWSFHHGDEQKIRGGPPGFWEIFQGHSVNGIILQRLTDVLDGGLIIRKGFFPVIKHSYSAHYDELLRYGIDILEFAVENLKRTGEIKFTSTSNSQVKIYKSPTNFRMIVFLLRLWRNRLIFNIKDLFMQEDWNVGLLRQNIGDFIKTKKLGKPLFAPASSNNKFKADVFIRESGGELELFFEDFDYKVFRGKISRMIFRPDEGVFSKADTFIEKDFHLAFPFYWTFENKEYLVAETSEAGNLTAFEIMDDKIVSEKIIMKSDCVDAVIFRHSGLYWMLCTRKKYGTNINLFLYYSQKPFENWESHPMNPVVSDVRKARMAGAVIKVGERLFRPAQKNDISYGEKIVIQEITELTKERYSEKEAFVLDAKEFAPYNKGVHTISAAADFIALDAKKYKFVPAAFARKLKSKLSR